MSNQLVRCPQSDEKRMGVESVLDKISFDLFPTDYMTSVMYSAKDWQFDLRTSTVTDETAMDASLFPGSKQVQWDESKIGTFDVFMENFKKTPLCMKIVFEVLHNASKRSEMTVDDQGRAVLEAVEQWDRQQRHDIMRVKALRLKPIDGEHARAKCNIVFIDEQGCESNLAHTGSIGYTDGHLGELGNYLTSEQKQKKMQASNGKQVFDEQLGVTDVNNASYSCTLNGHHNPIYGPLRFAKFNFAGIIADCLFFYHTHLENNAHPNYKECHDPNNNNKVVVHRFTDSIFKKIRGRYGSRELANTAGVYQKFKMPVDGTPRNTYVKLKTNVSFKQSNDCSSDRSDLERNNPVLKHISHESRRTFLETADTNRRYKHLTVANIVPGVQPRPMTAEQRFEISPGDLAGVTFGIVCYSENKSQPPNRHLLMIYPDRGIDVTKRRLFARKLSAGDSVHDEFYARPAMQAPKTILAVIQGVSSREDVSEQEACRMTGICWEEYLAANNALEIEVANMMEMEHERQSQQLSPHNDIEKRSYDVTSEQPSAKRQKTD